MTPYYEKDGITIYHGDAFDVLPAVTGVNLTVTSPPYNQSLEKIKPSGMQAEWNWAKRIQTSYHDSMDEQEYQQKMVDALDAVRESTAEDGSIFWNHKLRWRSGVCLHPLRIFDASKWTLRQELIWHRDGSNLQNAKMFPPDEERIFWGFKQSYRYLIKTKWLSVWKLSTVKNSAHPVEFPIEIPKRAILATTEPGDLVCDPFMGGGTTIRAAMELGRRAIGIDREERYCELAAKRLEQNVFTFTD